MIYKRKYYLNGSLFHIYSRGNNKMKLFHNDKDYMWFLNKAKKLNITDTFSMIAYTLMPNHYHFYVEIIDEKTVSRFMQRWLLSYAKYYNRHYNHTGHVFGGPYSSKLVQNDDYAIYLCKYIHLNPVRHNLVDKPEDWDYSNYCDVIGQRNGKLLDKGFYLNYFDNIKDYIDFVDDGRNEYEVKIHKYL